MRPVMMKARWSIRSRAALSGAISIEMVAGSPRWVSAVSVVLVGAPLVVYAIVSSCYVSLRPVR